ncbi:MAG: AI-2E family transporter [Isosphaeraceae bacterium]|nr:AI-2E family transporter [Isosphaeraceae bacterium]
MNDPNQVVVTVPASPDAAAVRRTADAADPFKVTLLIFAVIAFMYFTGEVLKPLALAVLLSFALAPAVRLLERCRLPRAAAVLLTVVAALGVLVAVGFVVEQQLTTLARRLPDYQENMEKKVHGLFQPGQWSSGNRLKAMADRLTSQAEGMSAKGDEAGRIQKVEVVAQPSFQDRLRAATGPFLEFLGVGAFVLILVLFILIAREDLSDRIVGLFGHRQISLTTRTMTEVGQRISRYLATFALVNSGYGLAVGAGLTLIGVPYAVLWGCLAALLRFIPYVGPAVAFLLPLVFSFVHFPGWRQPLEVVALFGVAETLLNGYLEPVIYGKTTGISALGLLVAAMFWTWLWGTVGLLLSTPLTVCLAVLGKYVPSLHIFATLLGEEAELVPYVRFYQRLVALDRDGAVAVVDAAFKQMSHADVFDQVLVRALTLAERDAARDELDDAKREFVWRIVGEILDGLEGRPETSVVSGKLPGAGESETGANGPAEAPGPVPLVGLAVEDTADALVLRMLGQLLAPSGCTLEIIASSASSMQVVERVAEQSPRLVVVSHLPPEGLGLARYQVRQLRAQFAQLPILVGHWGQANSASATERLVQIGATHVVLTLADARDRALELAFPERRAAAMATALRA